MDDPILVLEDDDLVVMYVVGRGNSAMTVFSQDLRHNLAGALGAINQIVPDARVRYRPAQGKTAAHVIVNFGGEVNADIRRAYAGAFVEAIKLLG